MTRQLLINNDGGEEHRKLATDATWHDTQGRLILMATTNCSRNGCKSTGGVYRPDLRTGDPQPLTDRARVREIASLNGWWLAYGETWLCPECAEEWVVAAQKFPTMTIPNFLTLPKKYPEGHPLRKDGVHEGPQYATSERWKPQEARK